MLVTCFLCFFFLLHLDPRALLSAMAVIRALALVLMVQRTAAVATTLANCQSACNLGEMLCLNKNASSTLCSAVQGACMAGCYASRVDCGCADASVTHCEEIKLRPTRMTPTAASICKVASSRSPHIRVTRQLATLAERHNTAGCCVASVVHSRAALKKKTWLVWPDASP